MITEVSTDSPRCQLISDDEKESLRGLPMVSVLNHYGDKAKPNGKVHCPEHTETTPSCHVYDHHLFCFGCWTPIDPIKYVMLKRGLGFREACQELAQIFNIPLGIDQEETDDERNSRIKKQRKKAAEIKEKRQALAKEKARERKEKRSRWPHFCVGRTHDFEEVASLRRIHPAGPWLAHELGFLHFAVWRGQLAWIVGDNLAAAARRLDGKDWEHHKPHKSDTLPGSEKHPIGLTDSRLPVIIVEGEPDYLAALARLCELGVENDYQVVAMLGAGARLGDAAKLLKGRAVKIYAHNDGSGVGSLAAMKWKQESDGAGASSSIVRLLPIGRDINDLTIC